jgi:FkbM family methyltransferase
LQEAAQLIDLYETGEGNVSEVPALSVDDAPPLLPVEHTVRLHREHRLRARIANDTAAHPHLHAHGSVPLVRHDPAAFAAARPLTAAVESPPVGLLPTLVRGARDVARRLLGTPARHKLVPTLRAYTRFMPTAFGKSLLWRSVIAPHFGWLSRDFEVSTRFGSRMRGNTQDFIQRHIYYFGLWEPNLTHFLGERLHPGDVFIDVGANIGYFSLQAARLVGSTGTVVAIEASPSIHALLNENLALNQTQNVRTVNLAVAERPSTLHLYLGPADNRGGTTLVASGTPGSTFECDVQAQPLGDIVTADEWRRARLVKIDVEGAEASVVAGMVPLLAQAHRELELVVEIAPRTLARQGKSPEDVLGIFRAAGFHAYKIENDYSADGYLDPVAARRPTRITGPLVTQTDVVFSRTDAAVL